MKSMTIARDLMLGRIANTIQQLEKGVPHWADPTTGKWTTTPDGDWTGGAWVGQLWLAHRVTGDMAFLEAAHRWQDMTRPRLDVETAFKGFTFYYGAALGDLLADDARSRTLALEAATDLETMFDSRLGLIPLGNQAEEGGTIGETESSIDSLQAGGLLLWAAEQTGSTEQLDKAIAHIGQVSRNHIRDDGSVIQSTTLDAADGRVVREHTHKGYSDTSTWARAQAWAMLYCSQSAQKHPDQAEWLQLAIKAANWWMANVPEDYVSYWDFDDPDIPNTERDTAATAIAAAALLKLAKALEGTPEGKEFRRFAVASVEALTSEFLTPVDEEDQRVKGMLTGGCFTKRPDTRPQDMVTSAELVFGSYFLLESLAILTGAIDKEVI